MLDSASWARPAPLTLPSESVVSARASCQVSEVRLLSRDERLANSADSRKPVSSKLTAEARSGESASTTSSANTAPAMQPSGVSISCEMPAGTRLSSSSYNRTSISSPPS
jgi:hypothetical protein